MVQDVSSQFKSPKQSDLGILLSFIVMLWVIEMADVLVHFIGVLGPLGLDRFGIWPREAVGLVGILTAPLLHGGFLHLVSNTLPLLVCGILVIKLNPTIWRSAVWWSWIGAGIVAWGLGSTGSVHVGASGVVFGLIGFLLVAGIVQKRVLAFLAAVLVGFFYGTALLTALPMFTEGTHISWESHLGGLLGGAAAAYHTRGRSV